MTKETYVTLLKVRKTLQDALIEIDDAIREYNERIIIANSSVIMYAAQKGITKDKFINFILAENLNQSEVDDIDYMKTKIDNWSNL